MEEEGNAAGDDLNDAIFLGAAVIETGQMTPAAHDWIFFKGSLVRVCSEFGYCIVSYRDRSRREWNSKGNICVFI